MIISRENIKMVPVRQAQKFTISEIPGLRHVQQVVLGPKGFVPVHSIEIDAKEFDSLSPELAEELYGQIRSIFERVTPKEGRG
jgi:hypothetical protein